MTKEEIEAQETKQIETLLEERAMKPSPDGKVQITDMNAHMNQLFLGFASFSGGVRKSEDKPGLWEIITPQIDMRGQPVGLVKVYFRASQVKAIGVPFEMEKSLVEIVPAGAVPPVRGPNGVR